MRKELSIGLIAFGLGLAANQFFQLPEFVMGVLLGISLCFEIIGSLPEKAYQTLKQKKKMLFNRI